MAESGAIATAARLIKLLELSEVNNISDNETVRNILRLCLVPYQKKLFTYHIESLDTCMEH